MSEIKAVIFDLGGVLVKHRNAVFVREINTLVADPGKLQWNNKKAIRLLKLFELGRVEPKQFFKGLTPFMKEKISFSKFKKEWVKILASQPAVARYLKKLHKSGYKIGIVSTCDAIGYPDMINRYKLLPFIDAAATSFKVHSRKPDKKIFLTALKGLGEKPENCVYIDDLQKYVLAARALGMNAIQFKNLPQLKKELAKFGVKAE